MTSAVYVLICIPSPERELLLKGDVPTPVPSASGHCAAAADGERVPACLSDRLQSALQELGITDAVWTASRSGNGFHVCFPCDPATSDALLALFAERDIASHKETSIGYELLRLLLRLRLTSRRRSIIPFSFFQKDDDGLLEQALLNGFAE